MLAELRSREPDLARRRAHPDGDTHHPRGAEGRMVERRDVAVRDRLRVVGQVVDRVHDREDEIAALGEATEPFGARPAGEDLVEERDAGGAVHHALEHRREARIGRRLGNLERRAELRPVAVGLQHAERDPLPVAAAVVVPERIDRRAPRLAGEGAAEHEARRETESLEPGHRAEV